MGSQHTAPRDRFKTLDSALGTDQRINLMFCWGGGNSNNLEEPTQTQCEHSNSTQKGPATAGISTPDLLVMNSANHCTTLSPLYSHDSLSAVNPLSAKGVWVSQEKLAFSLRDPDVKLFCILASGCDNNRHRSPMTHLDQELELESHVLFDLLY